LGLHSQYSAGDALTSQNRNWQSWERLTLAGVVACFCCCCSGVPTYWTESVSDTFTHTHAREEEEGQTLDLQATSASPACRHARATTRIPSGSLVEIAARHHDSLSSLLSSTAWWSQQ
jgi:hypothetical protein